MFQIGIINGRPIYVEKKADGVPVWELPRGAQGIYVHVVKAPSTCFTRTDLEEMSYSACDLLDLVKNKKTRIVDHFYPGSTEAIFRRRDVFFEAGLIHLEYIIIIPHGAHY